MMVERAQVFPARWIVEALVPRACRQAVGTTASTTHVEPPLHPPSVSSALSVVRIELVCPFSASSFVDLLKELHS